MCIPYAPRDRDVAIRLTCALLGAWTDHRDNLADLCGSVHSSAARANLQSRESLVRDTKCGGVDMSQICLYFTLIYLDFCVVLSPFCAL